VITLGVDLAAQAANTAVCELDWDARSDNGTAPSVGVGDHDLLARMRAADVVAIDAPFGWPDAFRRALDVWAAEGEWEAPASVDDLRFRLTDLDQRRNGRLPLSVSTDRIGITAMRCARLLAQHHRAVARPLDRVHGRVIEVYPAGALRAWGIPVRGYKAPGAHERRHEIAATVARAAGLDLCAATLARCEATDHALDALVCSLIARARTQRLTEPVPDEPADRIAREGWIHRPRPGSLEQLAVRA
jgi:predicted nuclease with RNAse H fold